MNKIKFFNEDCRTTMNKMKYRNIKCNIVLTSPFYNTSRSSACHNSQKSRDNHEGRYDVHLDNMTAQQYIDFTLGIFGQYNEILKEDGVILYNLSYCSENTHLLWLTIASIIQNTEFTIADDIIWKKKSALPNNVSSNKLTRIVEHVFVFCRKSEFKTFQANKKVKSMSNTGQKFYENTFNFIEAKNNDGSNKLNKATYSTDLCEQLLKIYAREGDLVYDSFMGTGTTAITCEIMNMDCIGSEISQAQYEFSKERLQTYRKKEEK